MDELEEGQSPTETKIFDAARKVFQSKGFEGARMQEIADVASINKSMLHYYFRSKDKLFEKVYQLSILKMIPQIAALLNEDIPLDQKIRGFASRYLEIVRANPDIPLFIIHELNKNPGRLKKFMLNEMKKNVQPFFDQIKAEHAKGNTHDLPPEQLIINLFALMVFPFIARPILQVMLEKQDAEFDQLINERVQFLPDYAVSMILK